MNKFESEVYTPMEPSPAAAGEQDLLRAAQQGDRAAFGRLVGMYQRRAYGAAYGIVGNRHDAMELAQEGFARAFKAMGRFDLDQPFYPWLYRIIKNAGLNHLKKKRRHGEVSLEGLAETGYNPSSSAATPRQAAERLESRAEVRRAIDALPDIHREILMLRHFDELSYQEIAERLNIAQGTVMSRLHAARKKLREALERGGILSPVESELP